MFLGFILGVLSGIAIVIGFAVDQKREEEKEAILTRLEVVEKKIGARECED